MKCGGNGRIIASAKRAQSMRPPACTPAVHQLVTLRPVTRRLSLPAGSPRCLSIYIVYRATAGHYNAKRSRLNCPKHRISRQDTTQLARQRWAVTLSPSACQTARAVSWAEWPRKSKYASTERPQRRDIDVFCKQTKKKCKYPAPGLLLKSCALNFTGILLCMLIDTRDCPIMVCLDTLKQHPVAPRY